MHVLSLQTGQQRAAELREEAARAFRARQLPPARPPGAPPAPGVRALLARLRLV